MINNMQPGIITIFGVPIIYGLCVLLREKVHAESRAYYREKDMRLRQSISDSLEESKPIHLDIGNTMTSDCGSGTLFAAIETTEAVSTQMAFADKPWTITATGVAASIEKEAVQSALNTADYGGSLDTDSISSILPGNAEHILSNFSFLEKEPSALHIAIGSFGPAAVLQDMAFSNGEILCTAGNDWLSQASGTITADEVYIGEQVYEIPGSLRRNEQKYASLLTMDVLRIILIVLILIFSAAGLSGI